MVCVSLSRSVDAQEVGSRTVCAFTCVRARVCVCACACVGVCVCVCVCVIHDLAAVDGHEREQLLVVTAQL